MVINLITVFLLFQFYMWCKEKVATSKGINFDYLFVSNSFLNIKCEDQYQRY